MNPICGPCGDGICEWMGCSMPGACVCDEVWHREHPMAYRAGTTGLGHLGIPDDEPHWFCECGKWRFPARPSPVGGPNEAEARRAHDAHIEETQ